ncbi:putative zinc finger protein [Orchesella cincta]|uniref:Putative zinc finger protein n=1 Tax=Orchesella cincta TaxID=48709 RepID=A0A1D2M9C6_ORCCI|nr:putative zinc finger protein [Orchesella cincta]
MALQKSDKYQCPKCEKCFAAKKTLTVHKKVHSQERPHQCTLCEKNYKYKNNLSNHVKAAHSTGAKSFLCQEPQCSFSSYILSGLRSHVRKVHQGKTYTRKAADCLICGKTLTTKAGRDLHIMAVHTNERPFSCTICGRAFSNKTHLKRHFETHSGLKPYKCTKCSSSFATQGGLYNHDKVVHVKARIHPCSFCDKKFITTGDRNAHLATHLRINEKLQKCKLCGKRYASVNGLKYHIKIIHRKVKNFPCSQCPKTFGFKHSLNAHAQTTHTSSEKKRFECVFCEKRYGNSGSLNFHLQGHTGERPQFCGQCPKEFRELKQLNKHTKTHHKLSN